MIENTDVRLILHKSMWLRRVRLKLWANHRSISMTDELISKLEGIIILAEDGKHGLRVSVPMAVDSGKGFALAKSNS
jgi:hypothetical protein